MEKLHSDELIIKLVQSELETQNLSIFRYVIMTDFFVTGVLAIFIFFLIYNFKQKKLDFESDKDQSLLPYFLSGVIFIIKISAYFFYSYTIGGLSEQFLEKFKDIICPNGTDLDINIISKCFKNSVEISSSGISAILFFVNIFTIFILSFLVVKALLYSSKVTFSYRDLFYIIPIFVFSLLFLKIGVYFSLEGASTVICYLSDFIFMYHLFFLYFLIFLLFSVNNILKILKHRSFKPLNKKSNKNLEYFHI